MKETHTPGPWIFNELEMKIKGSGDIEGRTVIANVSPRMDFTRGMTTQCANAQLIAAAPDLLEALQYCSKALKVMHTYHTKPIIERAEIAIKKATE